VIKVCKTSAVIHKHKRKETFFCNVKSTIEINARVEFKIVQHTAPLISFSAPIHPVTNLCYIRRLIYEVKSQTLAASANTCGPPGSIFLN